MNQYSMVAFIVLVVMVASVLRAWITRGSRRAGRGEEAENQQLREEVLRLKDRVAVLERIATDKNHLLEQEFERLRDR